MASHKLYTISVLLDHGRIILQAQCKASLRELLTRVAQDDPCWTIYPISITKERRWKNKYFRRGLAFRARVVK